MGIAIVLAVTMAANITLAIVASRDEAFAVEPDYYRKAVHFDDEMALRAASIRLGWNVQPTLRLAHPGTPGALGVRVTDASGKPLTGATVKVLAMHNARASHLLQATLSEVGEGRYATSLDARRPGAWELRFTVTRSNEVFATTVRLDALGARATGASGAVHAPGTS